MLPQPHQSQLQRFERSQSSPGSPDPTGNSRKVGLMLANDICQIVSSVLFLCSSSRRSCHYGGAHHQPESRRPPQLDLPCRQRQASSLHHLDAERRSHQWSHLLQGEAGWGWGHAPCSSLASERCTRPDAALHTAPKHLGRCLQLCRAETLTLHHPIQPSRWRGWEENSQEDASEKPQTVTKMGSALNLAGFLYPLTAYI